jgi:hypothetical protein
MGLTWFIFIVFSLTFRGLQISLDDWLMPELWTSGAPSGRLGNLLPDAGRHRDVTLLVQAVATAVPLCESTQDSGFMKVFSHLAGSQEKATNSNSTVPAPNGASTEHSEGKIFPLRQQARSQFPPATAQRPMGV